MIDCSGLVVIPEANNLKEVETPSGFYLDFNIVSQERGRNNEIIYHRYRANMWVPKEEIGKWRDRLVPRTVIKFAGAKWSATNKDENKYPLNVLRLNYKDVIPLAKPLWAQEEG